MRPRQKISIVPQPGKPPFFSHYGGPVADSRTAGIRCNVILQRTGTKHRKKFYPQPQSLVVGDSGLMLSDVEGHYYAASLSV